MWKITSPHPLKHFAQILVVNMFLMSFRIFCNTKGSSQKSCPYTPQQNGVSERKNRHLLDIVRLLLLESSVPPKFWPEALSTAVHVINRLPSPRINHETPYFCLFHKHPIYSHLHVFGFVCFVLLPQLKEQNYLLNLQTVPF